LFSVKALQHCASIPGRFSIWITSSFEIGMWNLLFSSAMGTQAAFRDNQKLTCEGTKRPHHMPVSVRDQGAASMNETAGTC
jgi:hypothetical protein